MYNVFASGHSTVLVPLMSAGQIRRQFKAMNALKSKYSLWENTDFFCLCLCTEEYKKIRTRQKSTAAKKKKWIERSRCSVFAVSLRTERRVGEVGLKVVSSSRVVWVQVGLKHPLQQSVHGSITWRPVGGERTETPGSPVAAAAAAASHGAAADIE